MKISKNTQELIQNQTVITIVKENICTLCSIVKITMEPFTPRTTAVDDFGAKANLLNSV